MNYLGQFCNTTIVQGMFKKRLNFLDSVPTSTEGVLWLLSTPNVKF